MSDKHLKIKFQKIAPWLLVIFHIIGLALFCAPERVLGLSGFNIFFCALMLFFSALNYTKELVFLVVVYIGGMLIEIVGVSTGVLFGTYSYGGELGLTLYGVPLVMGLNWYCVVAACSSISLRFFPAKSLFFQSILAAFLCTIMDYFIEPVAIKFDFWTWENEMVPISNYVCWFIFSFIFNCLYLNYTKKYNLAALALFFIWLTFFTILNFI
jgi:bisanhydrobacterioruberin hydratase